MAYQIGGAGDIPSQEDEAVSAANWPLRRYFFNARVDPPPKKAIFDGLLSADDLAVYIGREKSRKSNVALQFAMCASSGRDFLNFRFGAPRPLPVCLIDFESNQSSLHERYCAISRSLKLTENESDLLQRNLQILQVRAANADGQSCPRFPKYAGSEEDQADEFWKDFVERTHADLYIIDPLRCFHSSDENDSTIEQLLTRLRTSFRGVAILVLHHTRKRGYKSDEVSLRGDMRAWSDNVRGSSAIKAHSDVIICQEREISAEVETLYLGAFGRDIADIDPIPLLETDAQSFLWWPSAVVPAHLSASYQALIKAGGQFSTKTEAAKAIETGVGKQRSTAFNHVKELSDKGLLVSVEGGIRLCDDANHRNPLLAG